MKLSTVMPRRPPFGASVRPLRLRPPSMKYAIGNPFGEHRVQVLAKHGGIQRLALEAPAQEERAATPQDRPHDREIEVGAGGDVRRRQPLRMDEVRQQQVVDVAAMVGQVDEPLARRDFGDLVGVQDLDRRRTAGAKSRASTSSPARTTG